MGRDRSLDEFLDGEAEGSHESGAATEEGTAAPESDATGDSGDTEADETPAPAVSTAAFAPDGATCPRCGETVERRWRHEGELVCAACKEWSVTHP